MASNHTTPTAGFSPTDAMLTDVDTPERQEARSEISGRIKQRITSLDPKVSTCESWSTVVVRWKEGTEERQMEFPIHSLTPEEGQEIAKRHSVNPEDVPDIPEVWDEEHEGWVRDTTSAEYIQYLYMLSDVTIPYRHERLLMALDCELIAADSDEVVWSPAWSHEKKNQYREQALESIKAFKLQGPQLKEIDDAIDALSIQAAKEKAAELEGESQPPSASRTGSSSDGTGRGRRRSQRRTR